MAKKESGTYIHIYTLKLHAYHLTLSYYTTTLHTPYWL